MADHDVRRLNRNARRQCASTPGKEMAMSEVYGELSDEYLASVITELSKAFLSNYFRALDEARIAVPDVSELDEDDLASALSEAAQQNAEMIEHFTSLLKVEGNPAWQAALNTSSRKRGQRIFASNRNVL